MKKGNRKTGKNVRFIPAGAALALMAVAFAFFTASYIHNFDTTLMEENEAHLAEIGEHIVVYIQSVVRETQASLQTAANAVPAIPKEYRLSYLEDMAARQDFIYAGYAWGDGALHATEPSQNRDISKETYYQGAMEGKSTVSGLVRRIFTDRAVTGIVMSVPIREETGKVTGAVMALLDLSRLNDAVRIESFQGEGYSYIIDREGNLVLHNKSMDYNNFFRVLEHVQIKEGGGIARIRDNMEAGRPGMLLYDQLGTSRYAYYCPLGLNSWTVVNIVSKDVITAKTERLTKELAAAGMVVITLFLLLVTATGIAWMSSQNQRHAAETKSIFLANMSHEIRTPMNAIVGISEILLRSSLMENQKEYVRSILNSGKGLLTIMNDILDISKMESGKFTIVNEEYEMESLLYDITAITAIRIGDRPAVFLTDIDASVPSCLIGDSTRVKQILLNIIGNAVKFTEKGMIRLSIRAKREDKKFRLVMRVADTGLGIKAENIEEIFVEFNQIDTHYSHGKEGTGLGLAISRSLSRMMGGDITVESEYGKGSVFTITLLQEAGREGTILKSSYPENAGILILERAEPMTEYFESCLKQMGLRYKICSTEREFEEGLSAGTFTHALAEREKWREQSGNRLPEGVRRVILLRQQEHSLMSSNPEDLTVYAPLFGLQLSSLLASGDALREQTLPSADQSKELRPLPCARVLIVDDNTLNQEIAEALMEPYGMEIDCVSSGQEAIEAVKRKEYDLVFLDYMMPEMDGVETLKKIRELPGEKYKKLPIAALTANATAEARAMFMREGFQAFLAKPIELDRLKGILETWLRKISEERKKQEGKHDDCG